MRRHFTARKPSDLRPHDHVAWRGESADTLVSVAARSFAAAAARGEQLHFVADSAEQAHRLAAREGYGELLERGVLHLSTVDAAYRAFPDTAALRRGFEDLLGAALRDGYSGICVVADNTRLADGTDEEFAAWLAWEAVADRLQERLPITGVCYFDRTRVPGRRMADLAALHPVLSPGFGRPSFQLFADGDALAVAGEVDTLSAPRFAQLLHVHGGAEVPVVDLSRLGFIDHRGLTVLGGLGARGRPVQVRGASPTVRRLLRLLDGAVPSMELR